MVFKNTFANKRQVKHISSSLEATNSSHSLDNVVNSEDITLKKIRTQKLSFEINTFSDTYNQKTSITEIASEALQIQAVDPNKKFKPVFKKILLFSS